MEQKKQIAHVVRQWVIEAGDYLRNFVQNDLSTDSLIIEEKTSPADLVTNLDKEIEHFFINKIKAAFPTDCILGEEGIAAKSIDWQGRVWIIDPIDGTLNFVKQQQNFCTMIALYEAGEGVLGFIYEVMNDELIWGGRGLGVFINDTVLTAPNDTSLAEGLVSVNAHMFLKNSFEIQRFAMQAIGIRMYGCAGISIKEVLKGNVAAYLTYLQPWDYAAGLVLATELQLPVFPLDASRIDLRQKIPLFFGTNACLQQYQKLNK